MLAYFSINFLVQLYRKPSETLSFFAFLHYKSPSETWSSYGSHFVASEKFGLEAELMAALAQKESSGSPWASPSWQFNFRPRNAFDLYRPASSAVGLFQFTRGTYQDVQKLCKNRDCPDLGWTLPTRLAPGESIEKAAQNLHRELRRLDARGGASWTRLAPVVHLCGAAIAAKVHKQGLKSVTRCGSHNLSAYLRDVEKLRRQFARYRGSDPIIAGR